jgi:hypothetical protein
MSQVTNKVRKAPAKKRETAQERCLREIEGSTYWSYYDENGPSNSHLKDCCIQYTDWAFSKFKANGHQGLFPTPMEWLDDENAFLKFKNSTVLDIKTGKEFVQRIFNKEIEEKGKARLLEIYQNDYNNYMIENVQETFHQHWTTLWIGHTIGAQILRAFKTNKERLLAD